MTQLNALELAKQGNPQAIAALINYQLQPKGISAKAILQDACLSVFLDAEKGPNQQELVNFIRKGIAGLGVSSIEQVIIYGRQTGSDTVIWSQNLNLMENMNTTAKRNTRKAYQFIQIRVQLLGRGITNEIMNLYVNGKKIQSKVKTLHEFMNYLGAQGFQVVTAEIETEGIYTHFYTLQREVYTQEIPSEDIFDILDKTKEGADFGDQVRNMFEFFMFDNFY